MLYKIRELLKGEENILICEIEKLPSKNVGSLRNKFFLKKKIWVIVGRKGVLY